jgi:hypothetical protein
MIDDTTSEQYHPNYQFISNDEDDVNRKLFDLKFPENPQVGAVLFEKMKQLLIDHEAFYTDLLVSEVKEFNMSSCGLDVATVGEVSSGNLDFDCCEAAMIALVSLVKEELKEFDMSDVQWDAIDSIAASATYLQITQVANAK